MADLSAIAYDVLKTAVERVAHKLREGKKLSTEDIFILYLGTIVDELKDVRKDLARLEARIDETNKRIDALALEVQRQFVEVHRRIDETNKRIDEVNKRIDALQTTLLEIQKLLIDIVKKG